MVGENDALDPRFDGEKDVFDRLDTFDDDREGSPLFDPGDVRPGHVGGLVARDGVGDTFARGRIVLIEGFNQLGPRRYNKRGRAGEGEGDRQRKRKEKEGSQERYEKKRYRTTKSKGELKNLRNSMRFLNLGMHIP